MANQLNMFLPQNPMCIQAKPQEYAAKGKSTLTARCDEAIKTLNEIPSIPQDPVLGQNMYHNNPIANDMQMPKTQGIQMQMPYMMMPPSVFPQNMCIPQSTHPELGSQVPQNNMYYLNYMAQVNQYQQFMQQMQKAGMQIPQQFTVPQPVATINNQERALPAKVVEPPKTMAIPEKKILAQENSKQSTGRYNTNSSRTNESDEKLDSFNPPADIPLPTSNKNKETEYADVSAHEEQTEIPQEDCSTGKEEKNLGNKPCNQVKNVIQERSINKQMPDEIPIKTCQKNFFQLLEDNLIGGPSKKEMENNQEIKKPKVKKEFLKRKSQAIQQLPQAKKYNYFDKKITTEDAGKNHSDADCESANPPEKTNKKKILPKKAAKQPKNSYLSKGEGMKASESKKKAQKMENSEPNKRESRAEFQKYEKDCEIENKLPNIKKKASNKPKIKEDDTASNPELQIEEAVTVKEKLQELTQELDQFKKEQNAVSKKKKEYEKQIKKHQKDVADFEEQKEKEMASIDEMKEKEEKKWQQEKRVIERQAKAMQNVPNKKEKEEIDELKKENAKLREDSKAKDSRYKIIIDKLKTTMEELTAKNAELTKQVNKLLKEKDLIDEEKDIDEIIEDAHNEEKEEVKEDIERDIPPAKVDEPKSKKIDLKEPIEEIAEISGEHESSPESKKDVEEEEDVNNEYDQNSETKNEKSSKKSQAAKQEKSSSSEKSKDIPIETEQENYDMVFNPKYHAKNVKLVSQRVFNDGKITKLFENGKTEITFNNGVKRETFDDGYTVVYFNNKDIKQVNHSMLLFNSHFLMEKQFIISLKQKLLNLLFLMDSKF